MTPDSLAHARALLAHVMAEVLREDTLTPLKDAIVALVKSEGTPTLAAVARLPGASGHKALTMTGKNVVLWDGLSWDAISAVTELQIEGRVRIVPTHLLVYFAEGEALRLPLATSNRAFKSPRWLPVVLAAGASS